MHKSILSLLVAVLLVTILAVPNQTAYAQVSIPADINKTFTPISIDPGGTSRLRVTIFNPNSFQLTNAAWTDNMPSQITVVGIVSNSCGGNVTANAGSSTISLSGGTVPAQSGSTPGECTDPGWRAEFHGSGRGKRHKYERGPDYSERFRDRSAYCEQEFSSNEYPGRRDESVNY
jgi:hypothetical protein